MFKNISKQFYKLSSSGIKEILQTGLKENHIQKLKIMASLDFKSYLAINNMSSSNILLFLQRRKNYVMLDHYFEVMH